MLRAIRALLCSLVLLSVRQAQAAGLFGGRSPASVASITPTPAPVPADGTSGAAALLTSGSSNAASISPKDGSGDDCVAAALRRVWERDFLRPGPDSYYARVASGAFEDNAYKSKSSLPGEEKWRVSGVERLRAELLAQLRDPLHSAASPVPFAAATGQASWLRTEVAMVVRGLIDVGAAQSSISTPRYDAGNKTRRSSPTSLFRAPIPRALRLRTEIPSSPPPPPQQQQQSVQQQVTEASPYSPSSQIFQQVLAGALAESVPGGHVVLLDEGTLRYVHDAALRELGAGAEEEFKEGEESEALSGVDAGKELMGKDDRMPHSSSDSSRVPRITRSAVVSALLDLCTPRRRASEGSGTCGPVFLVIPTRSHPRDLLTRQELKEIENDGAESKGTDHMNNFHVEDSKFDSSVPNKEVLSSSCRKALDLTSIRDVTQWLAAGTRLVTALTAGNASDPSTKPGPELDAVSRALACNGVWTSEASCELIFDSIRNNRDVGCAVEDVPNIFVIETSAGASEQEALGRSDSMSNGRESRGSTEPSNGGGSSANGLNGFLPGGMHPMAMSMPPMFLGAQAIEVRHHPNGSVEVRQVPMPPESMAAAAAASRLGPGLPSFMTMHPSPPPGVAGGMPMPGPMNLGPLIGRILEQAQKQNGGKEGNFLASIEAAFANATAPSGTGASPPLTSPFPVGLTAAISETIDESNGKEGAPLRSRARSRFMSSPHRAMLAMRRLGARNAGGDEATALGKANESKPLIRYSKLLRTVLSRNAVSIVPPEEPELLKRYKDLERMESQTTHLAANLLRLRARMNEAKLSLILPAAQDRQVAEDDSFISQINDVAETALVQLLAEREISPSELTLALVRALLLRRGQTPSPIPVMPTSSDEVSQVIESGGNDLPIWALAAGVGSVVRPSTSFLTQWSQIAQHRSGMTNDGALEDVDGNAPKRLTFESPSPPAAHAKRRTRADLASMDLDKYEQALAANVVFPGDLNVRFDEVGGLDDIKTVLRQSVTYPLKYPWLYSEGIAADALKGLLLFGPPGTGKTMLAKAVASEGQFSFLAVDAAAIENKWLGESEKNAKALFSLARKLSPCIIFLDEVDSILSSREHGSEDGSHGALTSVKTTIMQEWDGLRSGIGAPAAQPGSGSPTSSSTTPPPPAVIVVASTNRPFDLDEAVLRRLPRRLLVDLPDAATRSAILNVTLRNNKLAPDVNLTRIATEELEGYSGSDIKEVCREAVIHISHERAELLDALERNRTALSADRATLFRSLRPVTHADLQAAIKKLRASVSAESREMEKLIAWNEKFGEVKSRNKRPKADADANSHLALYI